MNVKLLLTITLVCAAGTAVAQHAPDTVLKSSTIEVIQSYKPQIKQAPKPEWIPQLPPVDTAHPTFNYDVPQQTLYYTYNSLPLHPLALGHETPKLPFANYVKIGAGNLSTLYMDAGIGGIKGANYETDFHLHYLSQVGDIKNQQSSLGGIEAEWLQHNKKTDWHTFFNGEMNQYYYYGYNHDLYYISSDSLRQTYTTLRLGIDMKNRDAKAKFSYDPAITGSLYTAALNTSEVNAGVNLPFEYKFDDVVQAMLAVSGDDAHLATKDTTRDNTVAAVSPGLRIHTGVFTGHAILSYAFGIGNNQYLLPDITASFSIANGKFTITGGYQATLRQNTYEQLSTENPYMFNTYTMMQTREDELFGELAAGVGDHLTLSGRISWWAFSGLPEFLNDISDHKQFYIVYDTVNALAFKFSARYKVKNKWSVGGMADFYGFTNGKQPHAWEEPSTRIKGDFTAMIGGKLAVSAYLEVLGGMYAKDANHNAVSMSPVTDIGGNVEYQIVKRLSVFAQVSNLLNSNYQRWYGYQSYGFNIYGGLRLKF